MAVYEKQMDNKGTLTTRNWQVSLFFTCGLDSSRRNWPHANIGFERLGIDKDKETLIDFSVVDHTGKRETIRIQNGISAKQYFWDRTTPYIASNGRKAYFSWSINSSDGERILQQLNDDRSKHIIFSHFTEPEKEIHNCISFALSVLVDKCNIKLPYYPIHCLRNKEIILPDELIDYFMKE